MTRRDRIHIESLALRVPHGAPGLSAVFEAPVGGFFNRFEMVSVDYTNCYFGLIAHAMQYSISLRYLLGWIFFLLDRCMPNDPRWATQITCTLRKKGGTKQTQAPPLETSV